MYIPSHDILVSVSIVTYNQKEFIRQTIDSILKQEVNFKYEIVIGDDCSSDGAREILKEYQAKFPEIIQLILHPRRYNDIPGRTNNITNLNACRGKYIAMMDGDDFWISKDKLQKQVDFMETHSDFAMSFHNTKVFSNEDDFDDFYHHQNYEFLREDAVFNHKDVARGWFIQTSSLLFRNDYLGEFPEWFWQVYSADYAIQLLVSQHGKVKYFKDILSARRMNRNSFSATNNETISQLKLRADEIKIFKKEFPAYRDSKTANERLATRHFLTAIEYIKLKNVLGFSRFLLHAIYLDHSIAGSFKNMIIQKLKGVDTAELRKRQPPTY